MLKKFTCICNKNYNSLPWQGEACKDKMYAGKTLCCVSLRGVGLCTVVITFGF